jgi:hypothetical protein
MQRLPPLACAPDCPRRSSLWTVARKLSFSSGPLDYSPIVSYTSVTPPMGADQLKNLSIIFNNQNTTAQLVVSNLIPPGALLLQCA